MRPLNPLDRFPVVRQGRGTLLAIPSYHFEVAFVECLRLAVEAFRPEVLAVELPDLGLERQIVELLASPERQGVLFLRGSEPCGAFAVSPTDSIAAAVRLSSTAGIPLFCVDLPPEEPAPWTPGGPIPGLPDAWAALEVGLARFSDRVRAACLGTPPTAEDARREAYMHTWLETLLSEYERVLVVVGAGHWPRIAERFGKTRVLSAPRAAVRTTSFRVEPLSVDAAQHIRYLGEWPRVATCYLDSRAQGEPFDVASILEERYRAAARRHQEAFGQVSVRSLELFRRTLAKLQLASDPPRFAPRPADLHLAGTAVSSHFADLLVEALVEIPLGLVTTKEKYHLGPCRRVEGFADGDREVVLLHDPDPPPAPASKAERAWAAAVGRNQAAPGTGRYMRSYHPDIEAQRQVFQAARIRATTITAARDERRESRKFSGSLRRGVDVAGSLAQRRRGNPLPRVFTGAPRDAGDVENANSAVMVVLDRPAAGGEWSYLWGWDLERWPDSPRDPFYFGHFWGAGSEYLDHGICRIGVEVLAFLLEPSLPMRDAARALRGRPASARSRRLDGVGSPEVLETFGLEVVAAAVDRVVWVSPPDLGPPEAVARQAREQKKRLVFLDLARMTIPGELRRYHLFPIGGSHIEIEDPIPPRWAVDVIRKANGAFTR